MYLHRDDDQQIDRYTGPYERWVFSQELGRPFAFPAIRSGPSTHITALMVGAGMLKDTPDLEVRVPPLWSDAADITPFAMRNLSEDFNETGSAEDAALAKALCALGATRYRLNMPIDPATWPKTYRCDGLPAGWTCPKSKPPVIIGIIDDGIPFMHRAFLDADGDTKMHLCWLQGARAEDTAAVPFGKEVTSSEINRLRCAHGNREIRAYQESGAIDRDLPELHTVLMHHASHGAHIAGIAAGNDPFVGAVDVPDDASIIAVQLPNTIAWDTSGFGKEMMMLSAIEYIFHRARLIAHAFACDEIPVVINFSYGWSANRHDGKSSFERAVQKLLTARQAKQLHTELVMPTGNNFANDMHARFASDDVIGGCLSFGWQIKPDDRTSSYLEIWLPPGKDPDGWTVRVTPPNDTELTAGGRIDICADPALKDGDPRRFTELEQAGLNIGQLSADKHL
ncbi:MAG TPA: S8 family serine peptidase, partial [Marivita sp.]|nr:S8 family serine peptidase [Marivita sp.]